MWCLYGLRCGDSDGGEQVQRVARGEVQGLQRLAPQGRRRQLHSRPLSPPLPPLFLFLFLSLSLPFSLSLSLSSLPLLPALSLSLLRSLEHLNLTHLPLPLPLPPPPPSPPRGAQTKQASSVAWLRHRRLCELKASAAAQHAVAASGLAAQVSPPRLPASRLLSRSLILLLSLSRARALILLVSYSLALLRSYSPLPLASHGQLRAQARELCCSLLLSSSLSLSPFLTCSPPRLAARAPYLSPSL
eukprot:1559855-Rhodomonas_salina.1